MIVRSTLIYGPAILLPRLVAFGLAIALTHAMPVSEYGLYALVVVLGEALDMSCSNWVRLSLLRLDASNDRSLKTGFRRSLMLGAATTAIGVAGGFAISAVVSPEHFLRFASALGVYVFGSCLLRLGLSSLQLLRRRAWFTALEVARAIVQLLAALMLVHVGIEDFWVMSVALSLVTVVAGTISVGLGWILSQDFDRNSATLLDRMRYGAPMIALSVTAYTVASLDRGFLKVLAGPEAVALYAAAYTLGRQPVDIVVNAVNQGSFPELMRRFDLGGATEAQAFMRRIAGIVLILLVGAFVAVWGLSGAIAQALMPQAYWSGVATLAPLIALAAVAQSLRTAIFDNVFHLYKCNWLQLGTFAPCVVVMVAACVLLIPRYGASGAAVATVLSTGAGLIGSALLSRRLLRFRVKLSYLGVALLSGLAGFLGCIAGLHLSTELAPVGRLLIGGSMGGLCWLAALAACNHSAVNSTWTRWTSARRKATEVRA